MSLDQKNRKTAGAVLAVFLGMCALAYAAFPLYNLFCKVTGYGGTTQVSESVPVTVGEREFTLRFNADISPDLPWNFKPLQKLVTVKSGENKLVFYSAENTSSEAITGVATYNVTPAKAGIYFNKIQCFCFDEQTLQPGEEVNMPISLFVDPDIEKDPNLRNLKTITLSYTFFPAK